MVYAVCCRFPRPAVFFRDCAEVVVAVVGKDVAVVVVVEEEQAAVVAAVVWACWYSILVATARNALARSSA